MNMEEGLVQAHKRDESDGELRQKLDVPVLPPGPMTLEGHEYQAIQQPYRTHRTSQEMLLPQFLDTRQPTIPQINGPQSGGQFVPFNPSMPKAAPPTSRSPQPERPRSRQKFDEQQGDEMHLAVEKRPAPYPEKDSGYTRTRSATAGVPSTAASSQETLVPDIHLHDVDGNVIGQPESEDFYSRVQHLRGVFRLAAEKSNDIENKALEFWLRMTAWWFLKGKSALEKSTKPSNQPDASRAGPGRTGQQSQQCYVDLAKAWWAMEDIIPDLVSPHSPVSIRNGLDKFDGLDYPQLLGVYHLIQANMHGFAIFMKRNNLLPPPALLIQGADPCIWIEYPALPQGTLCLTAGLDPRTLIKRTRRPFFPILFGDTERHFNYGRLFAEAEIVSDDGVAEDSQLPCIISIIRERTSSQVEITIVSQDGQINLHVQSDPKLGPTWKDVEWKVKAHSIRIRLSRDFEVALRLWDEDFRTLWGIDDYTRRVEADWQPEEHEDIVFDNKINVFHYAGPPQKSGNFPSFPITNCSVRLFKRSIIRVEGSAQRKLFDGVRFVVMTPPSSKILSSISRVFAKEAPILYSNLRGEKEAPALLLAIRESDEKTSLILTFEDAAQRADFHMLLSGIAAEPDEQTSNDIPLESMFVEDLFPSSSQVSRAHPLASSMQWKSARVISQGPREGLNHIMHSDRLRVRLSCSFGTIVDLINLGTGELQISLDSEDTRLIKLYRPAQDNLILSFAHNLYPKEEHGALQQTLQSTKEVPTARVYKFPVLKAMHDFQQLVTGFDVMYDGIATMFSISHRMNMIPIYKKQEATHARLQVLSYDNMGMRMIQLIIVLKDFPNGRIMNFQLRSTDTFETMSKSGKHCVRFDDAKFALPKQQDNQEMAWDYVCLDTPEYPGEHDDIVVGFDTEEGEPLSGLKLSKQAD